MTPKQAAAWAMLGFARKRAEAAEDLRVAALAQREKTEAINRQLKEWTDA